MLGSMLTLCFFCRLSTTLPHCKDLGYPSEKFLKKKKHLYMWTFSVYNRFIRVCFHTQTFQWQIVTFRIGLLMNRKRLLATMKYASKTEQLRKWKFSFSLEIPECLMISVPIIIIIIIIRELIKIPNFQLHRCSRLVEVFIKM